MCFDPPHQTTKTWTCIVKMHVPKTGKCGKWKSIQPKANAVVSPVAEAQALLKLMKMEKL